MKYLSVILLLWATPAMACHRYHTWRYPYPQRCYTALAHIPKLTKPIRIPAALPPDPPPAGIEDTYPPEVIYKLKRALDELQVQRR